MICSTGRLDNCRADLFPEEIGLKACLFLRVPPYLKVHDSVPAKFQGISIWEHLGYITLYLLIEMTIMHILDRQGSRFYLIAALLASARFSDVVAGERRCQYKQLITKEAWL
jgi:hypothetical protein